MLLLWAPSARPNGTSNLVTIRFSSSVCIESIRIVPQGVAPFLKEPHVVGQTEPASFPLKILMNYQHHPPSDDKPKASNSLISSSLQYDGEMLDHQINAGAHFSTRLLILQGEFDRLSLAVYGSIADNLSYTTTPEAYTHTPIRTLPKPSLPPSIDIARSRDLLLVARQLLSLANHPPTLDDMIRQLYETPGEEEQPIAHGLSLVEDLPTDSSGSESWLSNFVQQLQYLYSDPVLSSSGYSAAMPKICFGVFTLSAILVWATHAEQIAPVTKALFILKLWKSTEEYHNMVRSIASKTLLPTLVRIWLHPLSDQIGELSSPILRWLLSDPAYVFQPNVLSNLMVHGYDRSPLEALPSAATAIVKGNGEYAMDYVTHCLGQTAEDLQIADLVALSFAIEKLRAILVDQDAEDWDSLQNHNIARSQELPYVLLDIISILCQAAFRRSSTSDPAAPWSSDQYAMEFCRTATAVLRLFLFVCPSAPLTTRVVRDATNAIIRIHLVNNHLLRRYQSQFRLQLAAEDLRHSTFTVLQFITGLSDDNKSVKVQSIVLQTLLLSVPIHGDNRPRTSTLLLGLPGDILELVMAVLGPVGGNGQQGLGAIRHLAVLLPELAAFTSFLSSPARKALLAHIIEIDGGGTGVGEWLVANEMKQIETNLKQLAALDRLGVEAPNEAELHATLLQSQAMSSARVLRLLAADEIGGGDSWLLGALCSQTELSSGFFECLSQMHETGPLLEDILCVVKPVALLFTEYLAGDTPKDRTTEQSELEARFGLIIALSLLRSIRIPSLHDISTPSASLVLAFKLVDSVAMRFPSFIRRVDLETLQAELGLALSFMVKTSDLSWGDRPEASLYISAFMDFLQKQQQPDTVAINEEDEYDDEYAEYADNINGSRGLVLSGVNEVIFDKLTDIVDQNLPDGVLKLASLRASMAWGSDWPTSLLPSLSFCPQAGIAQEGSSTFQSLLSQSELTSDPLNPSTPSPPSTPPTILGLVSLSPFTVLRSPSTKVSSLTKTYANNDFRQLRNSPHINTSRPPSMHVDAFQASDSPPQTASNLLLQSIVPASWLG